MNNIFFDHWGDPWSTLPFQGVYLDATDLAEDSLPYAYAEIGYPGENSGIEFGVVDYLDNFHKAYNFIDPDLLEDEWLTKEALAKIQKFFQEQLESSRYCNTKDNITGSLEVSDYMGDEPHYVATIVIPYDTEGTVQEVIDKYANNFFACIQNTTDPGTFNEPYLFSEIK